MIKNITILIFSCGLLTRLPAQTTFDSLKRNSNLDTSYRPSQKPTFITEFAEVKISGFIQPALYFDNNNVLNKDLFVTSDIPTTKITDIKFRRFHLSANQSRLGFHFTFPKVEKKTTALLEADFFSSSEGKSSYLRLRHAYVAHGESLIGQTWTNFGDISSSPNTLDLEGPNSMPAYRVTQIRWGRQMNKKWNLILALEEPRGDYTPLDSASVVRAAMPEMVVKPKLSLKNGHWSNSVIYKPIIYTDKTYSFKKKLRAWGYTSSLVINLADNKVKLLKKLKVLGVKNRVVSAFFIIGNGTQGAVNDFGGLGYEAFPKDSTTLETLSYYGGYISYSFVFNKRWSSTYVYSYLHQEKPQITDNIFKRSHYFAANGIYAVNKYFTMGAEILYGAKENHDNTNGNAYRLLGVVRILF